jgi:DHA1 family inner membrane transport protein
MVAATVVAVLLPSSPVRENPAATAPEPSRFRFAVLVTVVTLVVAGFFTFYTYVSVFLTREAGLPSGSVGAVLAVGGVAGLLGTSVAGVLSDRSPRATMTGAVGLITAALALPATAGTQAYVAIAAVALLSLAMSIMIIALTSRVLRIAPGHVDVASAAGSAAFQAGIALGSFLGGGLLDAHGPHSTVVIGTLLCAAGLALLLAEEPLTRRSRPGGDHSASTASSSAPPSPYGTEIDRTAIDEL